MTDQGKTGSGEKGVPISGKEPGQHAKGMDKPDWANGLKQFYDSVVEEPLPDELAQLLARFDEDES